SSPTWQTSESPRRCSPAPPSRELRCGGNSTIRHLAWRVIHPSTTESIIIDKNSIERLYGALVFDSAGDKIGKVGTIYLNDHTNEATFVTVTTGLFGMFESLVPLQAARLNGDDLLVEYTKDQVKDAPRIDAGRQLSPDEEVRLYEYYRLGGDATLT